MVGTVTEQHRPFTGRSDDAVRTQREPLGYTIKRLHKKKRLHGNISGRKDNKGENARINSQGTVQKTTATHLPCV